MPILETRGLTKRFGGLVAVNGVDLSVEQGEIFAMIGPNGAGKTTVFNLLTGSIRPDAGKVLLRGVELLGKRPDQVARLGMMEFMEG